MLLHRSRGKILYNYGVDGSEESVGEVYKYDFNDGEKLADYSTTHEWMQGTRSLDSLFVINNHGWS